MAETEERICRAIDQRDRDRMVHRELTEVPKTISVYWRGCMTISHRQLQGVVING